MAIISIKENHLIVYSGGAKYSGELVNVFKPTVYIHIPVWCVVDYPFRGGVEVDILGVLLFFLENYGCYQEFTIGLGGGKVT